MSPEDFAAFFGIVAFFGEDAQSGCDDTDVSASGYEADILAVAALCVDETEFISDISDFGFGILAEGEICAAELILREHCEDIALVF